MNEDNDTALYSFEPDVNEKAEIPHLDDDRYPGSFFRIPAPPIPGKTSWSLR